jgi:hypothetical protein
MKTNWPAFRCGFLILSSAALGANPMLAQTQEPAGATATSAVISSVAITQAPQHASVRVEGEGRLDVHASRMRNPERLVPDSNTAPRPRVPPRGPSVLCGFLLLASLCPAN